MVGMAKVKLPSTEALPPERVDAESGWPYVIVPAAGHAVTLGVSLLTVTETLPLTGL